MAFESAAFTLGPGTTGNMEVWVHDRHARATERASLGPGGTSGNGFSYAPSISGDGRAVAFASGASNLVPGDTNRAYDVFVRDRAGGVTLRVSLGPGGAEGNGDSREPAISGDGRFVAFHSRATNLVPGDTNGAQDVFVHDRLAGTTERVSTGSLGEQGNADSGFPSISADGRLVAFHSVATNLVPGDGNGSGDVFVHDRLTGRTVRASVSSSGLEGDGDSWFPSICGDGSRVAFESHATNLVPGDGNRSGDIFLRDLAAATTLRASLSSEGAEGDSFSWGARLSGDGLHVAFASSATNLVPGDRNGFPDIFVHHLQGRGTTRESLSSGGAEAGQISWEPALSAGGRLVAFASAASNLVANDTNGRNDVFVRDRGPWRDLGGALPGAAGPPLLHGSGTLGPGQPGSLGLARGAPRSLAVLFHSLVSVPVPFFGGTLLAFPPAALVPLGTDERGRIALPFAAPPALPPGLTLHFQFAMADPAAVQGVSLSNAVRALTP